MHPSRAESTATVPTLAGDSYIAVALQPRIYGCRNKTEVARNLRNQCRLIDEAMYTSPLNGGGPVRLVALSEGSIQGMWDEYSNMDQVAYCRDVAITIPGEETETLARKAIEHNIYLVAQAKVVEPEIIPDRYFNTGFIISPAGDIILKHHKNIISVIEGSTSPYDVWDRWTERFGNDLRAFYPVVKTDIGNLAVAICAETVFPETFRAFFLMGAEVIVKMSMAEPLVMNGYWEFINRARAADNVCYVVAANLGPYFTHPDVDVPYSLGGGHSMIVDYRGGIVSRAAHGNEGFVPGEINIKALREFRAASPAGLMLAQMRSGLWKQIYEQWPDYPRNQYLTRTYATAAERHGLHLQAASQLFDAGIFARPHDNSPPGRR